MKARPPSARPSGTNPRPFFPPKAATLRRAAFFGTALAVNTFAVLWMADLLWRTQFQKAHYPLLAVFAILNLLLVLGFLHAATGALDMILPGRRSVRITKLADSATGPLRQRHAVVMPVYNEDNSRTCARIEAIFRSIRNTGHLDSFDFFLLSDTRNPDLWILEETAWANLCRNLDGFGRIYYRRRKINENRKAGNIGDFVRTWGGGYESMLVLDADSLMDGADIVKMVRTMEACPRLGILQTPPSLIHGSSLFTRLQQFAMSLYSPLFLRGLNFWQLGGGSYWGHNALIRLKPFSESCELPALPGREPFGGRILSHDFVEAALMVAQGWEVWLAWDIRGTYEEAPPSLTDHLVRDRRWMQGNLQHLWLIFARKLPFSSRIHLFMGIMAYLSGPLWFLFLLLATWIAYDRYSSRLSELPFENFAKRWLDIPAWHQSTILAGFVLSLLFVPKVLAVIRAISLPRIRHSFGGASRVIAGSLLETIASMLIAPCIMATHTAMVMGLLAGKSVDWGTQNRETDGTPWSTALRFHAFPTLLGIIWTALAIRISPVFAAWMSPILAGLVLSIPISVWSSRCSIGRLLASRGLLATPEEHKAPEILQLAAKARAAIDPALNANHSERRGIVAAVVDPYVNGVHVSLLDASELGPVVESLAERCLTLGPTGLNQSELTQLLYSAPAMLLMHRAVWLRPSDAIHPAWTLAVQSYRGNQDPQQETV